MLSKDKVESVLKSYCKSIATRDTFYVGKIPYSVLYKKCSETGETWYADIPTSSILKEFNVNNEQDYGAEGIGFYDTSSKEDRTAGYLFMQNKFIYKDEGCDPQVIYYKSIVDMYISGNDQLNIQLSHNKTAVLDSEYLNTQPLSIFLKQMQLMIQEEERQEEARSIFNPSEVAGVLESYYREITTEDTIKTFWFVETMPEYLYHDLFEVFNEYYHPHTFVALCEGPVYPIAESGYFFTTSQIIYYYKGFAPRVIHYSDIEHMQVVNGKNEDLGDYKDLEDYEAHDWIRELHVHLRDGRCVVLDGVGINKMPLLDYLNRMKAAYDAGKILPAERTPHEGNREAYRAIQKEQELRQAEKEKDAQQENTKQQENIEWQEDSEQQEGSKQQEDTSQELDAVNTALLSMGHIVTHNPIIYDSPETKKEYLRRLGSYIKAGRWERGKYVQSELSAYSKIVLESENAKDVHGIEFYRYYILFDMMHVLGYEENIVSTIKLESVKKRYFTDFPKMEKNKHLVNRILQPIRASDKNTAKQLEENPLLKRERKYIRLIGKNLAFMRRKPFRIMVTATMSAGKSTFINALTGKYFCLSQNMACTSKIHSIMNKAFEDGYSYEYDHDLVLTAGREELLNDDEQNTSDKIVAGSRFNGYLENQRIIINDSPGVNYSGDESHKIITDKLIKAGKYNLLIYLMNATQLATNDEDEHLDFVRRSVGDIPVIFVINKVDTYNVEEEDIVATAEKQTEYLKKKGFENPIVCPVSAKAGYLAKRFAKENVSMLEKMELYSYVNKFKRMKLPEYYERVFKDIHVKDAETEKGKLLKTSGLAFVERIIALLVEGKKINSSAELHESPSVDDSNSESKSMFAGIHNPIFPVNVISTMSSGKSTLINALLGRRLMPSRNAACTATVTEVLNNGGERFTAVAYDENDAVLKEVPELTYGVMSELNEDSDVQRIIVEGNIPFLDASTMALKLVDIPGPNNLQNRAHKNTTYRAINSNSSNLILYILNGTQLSTNDDTSLLAYIAEQIKKGGKQARDRFLFVINKMDAFNPEEEDIREAMARAKRYLASYGIEDPQVFPCSAYTALNIETYFDGIDIDNLTRSEERQLPSHARDTLPMIDKLIDYDSMHLEQYSTLSPNAQKELNYKLNQAERAGDTKEQALIHSGIYSIEAAIVDHVKRYVKARGDNRLAQVN